MSASMSPDAGSETEVITVRYWASARSAAGVEADRLPVEGPISLTEVVTRAVGLHPGSRLAEVLHACSVLVGDRPVASAEPDDVRVAPGASVEFLPPFAGG
ncbi:MAG TPA: MoaD/ThiS family protein [Nocardioides sp.]|nr:MoaD/ThiS family protein [Nocardioides sp.]